MRPVLVDTSVWRHFFAGRANARMLGTLLDEYGVVLVHPMVVGELVLGGISAQQERLMRRLPQSQVVPHDEVLAFVRRRRLARRGIGWVDAALIASALTSEARLWSFDVALDAIAGELGINFEPGEVS
jgi:predicted nucleic acid-binding protein